MCVQCWTLFCYELFSLSLSLYLFSLCFYVLLILCLSYHNCIEYKNNSVHPFINIQMRVIDWCLNGHNPLPLNAPPTSTLFILIFSVCFLMCTKRPPFFLLLLLPATKYGSWSISSSTLFPTCYPRTIWWHLMYYFFGNFCGIIAKQHGDVWPTFIASSYQPSRSFCSFPSFFKNYFSVLLVIVLSHTALILSMCVSVFYIHSLDSSNQHFSLQPINSFHHFVCNIHRYFFKSNKFIEVYPFTAACS